MSKFGKFAPSKQLELGHWANQWHGTIFGDRFSSAQRAASWPWCSSDSSDSSDCGMFETCDMYRFVVRLFHNVRAEVGHGHFERTLSSGKRWISQLTYDE